MNTLIHPTITSATTPSTFLSRRVEQQAQGRPTSDGDGVKLTRLLDQPLQRRLDPFLMLDAFGSESASDYIGGFPSHPHRGFETVTYMLAGRMCHRDSVGNIGLLEPGSVQWMTAGRGIIHSEMPEQEEGRMAGFQLWVNLAAADKLQAPQYRDIPPADVPVVEQADGVTVRILAGESHGITAAVTRPVTEPLYLDITLPAGVSIDAPLPPGHNAFVVAFGGAVVIEGTRVETNRLAVLKNDPGAQGVRVQAADGEPARLLLIAGKPLNEPIVQYGPFVMNTEAEIRQAFTDFQNGALAA
ncbi:MAG: hypothetical protein RLZZ618_4264 [Pseudomonadota bacterium]|jgi:redox-sensitive bicupin YhaK (pirin superfamily)